MVSNAFGTATSANAVLTVNTPPIITAQPQSQTVIAGSSARFNFTATGSTPLTPNVTATGATASKSDPVVVGQRFCRVFLY